MIKKSFTSFNIIITLIIIYITSCNNENTGKDILDWAPYKPIASNTVNSIARQKTQLNSGIYDSIGNKTYIVYPGGINNNLSACSPYIMGYDHITKKWSAPVEIAPSPLVPDSHYYPQILQDDKGYIHVFHSFHGGSEIMHAKSSTPRNITNWDISYIPGTEHATYGAAYKAENGDFYISFRGNEKKKIECEPEYYAKSTDNGLTWEIKRYIYPDVYDDHWGTIYTKAMSYQKKTVNNPEGIALTFGLHKYHNKYIDKHFYAFLSFEDNHLYSASWKDLGEVLSRDIFESECELFSYGYEKVFTNVRMAADLDSEGNPWVFYSFVRNDGKSHLIGKKWDETQNSWDAFEPQGLTGVFPAKLDIDSNGSMILYTRTWGRKISAYYFSGKELIRSEDFFEAEPGSGNTVNIPTFIYPESPDITGFFIWGDGAHWRTPSPSGFIFTF